MKTQFLTKLSVKEWVALTLSCFLAQANLHASVQVSAGSTAGCTLHSDKYNRHSPSLWLNSSDG